MPNLETPDEVAQWVADKLGIYESQKYTEKDYEEFNGHPDDCDCRHCFVIGFEERIRQSVKNFNKLYPEPRR